MDVTERSQRKNIRLFDCSYLGDYFFVTICCEQRIHRFGDIHCGKVYLNELGEIASQTLREIECHYEGTMITDSVIMPDHIHFIIYIDKSSKYNLNAIVKMYKTIVNHKCLNIYEKYGKRMGKLWQRNYYESIIRNAAHYDEVRAYIYENPMNWDG